MTIRLGEQWADQIGHLGPGQAERGGKGGALRVSSATMAGLGFQPSFEQKRGQGERGGWHPGPPGGERPQRNPDSTFANSDAATPGTTPNGISLVTITGWWSDTVRS